MSKTKVTPYAWVILVVGFLASVAAPLCMFKVATVLTTLSEIYNLSLTVAGMMVSIFALTGFILAIPSGTIFQKLGLKWTCVVAEAFMIVGGLMGTVVTSGGMLLFSRFIEGAGMGLISVAVPAGLAMWFPDDRRGLAMGVWNNWMPIGNMIAFSVVPQIVARTNYKGAWWFTIAYSAVCLVLCLLFMRTPKPGEVDYGEAAPVGETVNDTVSKKQVTLKDALSNKNIWYIAIVSLCFGFVINILSTYYTTFTTENNIMTATQTGTALSIQNLMGMVCALLAGVILGRMKNRKMLLFWSMVGFSVLYLCLFKISSIPLIYLWLVVYSPFTAFAPTTLFTIAPDVMRSPEEASYGMSMVTLGQNLGMFIGAPIFGSLVTKIGWNGAGYCMIPILLIGAFFTWIVKADKEA